MSTRQPLALIAVERALSAIVRQANLPRSHERLAQRAGVALDRAAYPVLARTRELGPVRLSDLARELGVDLSTASRQVKDLEHAGLIGRGPDPADGRACVLALTREGERVLRRVRAARSAAVAEILADWSDDDLDTLADLMTRLACDLSSFVNREEQPAGQ